MPITEKALVNEIRQITKGMKSGDKLAGLMVVVLETLSNHPLESRTKLCQSIISLLHEYSASGTA